MTDIAQLLGKDADSLLQTVFICPARIMSTE